MRIEITLVDKADDGGPPWIGTIELDDMALLPRVGDRIHYEGMDYDVCEVTWDYNTDVVTVGART